MAKIDTTAKMTKNELAQTILDMSYGELLKVGDQLASIKHQRLDVAEDFAKLLHNWADAQ
jgi:hypothetical protein